jgi:hypothetical protein
LIRRGTADRWVLALGALGNLAVALVWLASRSVGLPIGPEVGQAEGIGLHDALASLDEVTIALLVGSCFLPPGTTAPVRGWWELPSLAYLAQARRVEVCCAPPDAEFSHATRRRCATYPTTTFAFIPMLQWKRQS